MAVHLIAIAQPKKWCLLFVCLVAVLMVPISAVSQMASDRPGVCTYGDEMPLSEAELQQTPEPAKPQFTTLVQQQAEQNTVAVAQTVEQQLWPDFGFSNETYDDLAASTGDDIVSNLFNNLSCFVVDFVSVGFVPLLLFISGVFTLSLALALSCQFRRS
ncbi:MAG: hypothetical protein JSS83_06725 [Cyanobacteria bacterium SZAS LIN-3]|nr:hypothetical protein [Cyanobacteria bacterium SZAS LIN-3]